MTTDTPRIAIAHDFLVSIGGAERVVVALSDLFPQAAIYTSIHEPSATYEAFAGREIHASGLNRLAPLRRRHRFALPILQGAFASMDVEADVIICSSTGFSHHVRCDGKKLVYCHSPARWLYDDDYLQRYGVVGRTAARALRKRQRVADQQAMADADVIVANSNVIAGEIEATYGRTARVIPPCSSLAIDEPATPIHGLEPGFVLCPSRAIGYKRLDILSQAAAHFPEKTFVHVGGGPAEGQLRSTAPPNLRVVGPIPDCELRWAYRNADLVVLTAAEDFGLVPLEASAHGVWSVVPRARGFLDHVDENRNGSFYDWASVDSLVSTLRRVSRSPQRGLFPARLNREDFDASIGALVEEMAA